MGGRPPRLMNTTRPPRSAEIARSRRLTSPGSRRPARMSRAQGPRCSSMIQLETVDAVPVMDSPSKSERAEHRSGSVATHDLEQTFPNQPPDQRQPSFEIEMGSQLRDPDRPAPDDGPPGRLPPSGHHESPIPEEDREPALPRRELADRHFPPPHHRLVVERGQTSEGH